MKENKLGTYLNSFTEQDWAAYHKFSKSLYDEKSDYQLVINFIKKYKHRIDPLELDAEYLRKKIRPSAKRQVFANVVSRLCKYVEQYLVWAEVEGDQMMKDTLLLQALAKRGLSNQFYQQKGKSRLKRGKLPNGLWHYYHDFTESYLLYFNNMTTDIKESKMVLKNAFENLTNFSSNMNHYLTLEMQNRTVLLKEDYEEQLATFEGQKRDLGDFTALIDITIKLKKEKSEECYQYLREKIKDSNLSREMRYTILIHLMSHLYHHIIKGNLTVKTSLLHLQKYGIEQGILFPNGKIPLLRFTNILTTACALEEYDWAYDFVEKYSHLVGHKNVSETKTLGNAQIEFSKKNFDEVVDLLVNTKFKTFEFELKAKWFLLCSNYELNIDNYSIIESYVKSFQYFIKKNRHKATELTFLSIRNSSKYILEFAKLKDIDKLIDNIKTEKNLLHRNWLMQKAKELK